MEIRLFAHELLIDPRDIYPANGSSAVLLLGKQVAPGTAAAEANPGGPRV